MKNSYFGYLLVLIFCLAFAFMVLSMGNKSEIDTQKKEQELGFVINGLESGHGYCVSDATHKYLFKRLQNEQISDYSKGTIELGMLEYSISEIPNGYVLTCPFKPARDQYHLLLEQRSININPAGTFVNFLFIIKQEGAYYNK
ncbi:TPA: hypothetical protein DCZ15_03215 [Candidatus Falkowbacteria bacterium]|nr:MAG: hypothetical protein UV95_C0002G0029 [Candidatus Falkowbacteria bacterium GW2011_GWF2_43_32]HBA36859.1 hypothetical protein [Candidatus Falkowbacteria bacterium]